jgi:hypothetical protein
LHFFIFTNPLGFFPKVLPLLLLFFQLNSSPSSSSSSEEEMKRRRDKGGGTPGFLLDFSPYSPLSRSAYFISFALSSSVFE